MTNDPPVLCLDTCTVLDILRDPLRTDVKIEEHAASLRLLEIAEGGTELDVRVAPLVLEEYEQLADQIQQEANERLTRFKSDIQKLDRLVHLHGANGSLGNHHWDGLVERCRVVSDRWLGVSKTAPAPPDVAHRAYERVVKPMRPARRGNNEFKDCVILETYLDFVAKIRATSSRKIVFVSSNVKDYANPRGNNIAEELESEFNALSLEYAPNMRTVGGLLGL